MGNRGVFLSFVRGIMGNRGVFFLHTFCEGYKWEIEGYFFSLPL